MLFPIGSMSVGDILDRGLKLLAARLGTFYAINLIMGLPILIYQFAAPTFNGGGYDASNPARSAGMSLGFLVILYLGLTLTFLGNAASLRVVVQEFVGEPCGVGEAIRYAMTRLWALIGTSMLAGLAIIGGYILLIVPGILFQIWFIFVGQIVVVECLSGSQALGRSKALTAGFRWRIFGVSLLMIVISLLANGAINLLVRFFPSYQVIAAAEGIRQIPIYPNLYINLVIAFLVQYLVAAYAAICWTLLYFDLRIRKEGYDLELAAKRQPVKVGSGMEGWE